MSEVLKSRVIRTGLASVLAGTAFSLAGCGGEIEVPKTCSVEKVGPKSGGLTESLQDAIRPYIRDPEGTGKDSDSYNPDGVVESWDDLHGLSAAAGEIGGILMDKHKKHEEMTPDLRYPGINTDDQYGWCIGKETDDPGKITVTKRKVKTAEELRFPSIYNDTN